MPRHEHSFMQMHLLDTASEAAAPAAATATAATSGGASEQGLREHGEGQPQRAKRERLQSLDALRGLNVIVMMFVDDTWIDSLDHAGWDGAYHLADFVMPTFLLMVGASMSFSMRKYGGPGLKWKVLSRTAKLFVIGCLTQGANPLDNKGIDLHNMRIMGILQRIAWAYCIVAMMKIYLPVRVASGDFLPPSVGKWVDVPGDKLMIFKHYALHCEVHTRHRIAD
jgi:heparan-alpha-glucosaminide N-acetyltransferase